VAADKNCGKFTTILLQRPFRFEGCCDASAKFSGSGPGLVATPLQVRGELWLPMRILANLPKKKLQRPFRFEGELWPVIRSP
jgi:hypothetical protein